MIVRRHIFHRHLIRPSYKKHRVDHHVEQWMIDLAEGKFKVFTDTNALFKDLDEKRVDE